MKVLHVFSVFGTANTFFDGQFAYLSRHGYRLHLVCSEAAGMGDFIRRNKIEYRAVEISRSITPLKDLKAIWQVCKYIHEKHIDVVVGHTPKGALVAMLAAFIMCRKRRVYYRHGLIYTTAHGLKRSILKGEERFVSLLAQRIVNVSSSLSALAVSDRLNGAAKQQIIGAGTCGGIDTQHKFNPALLNPELLQHLRAKFGINPDDYVVGFCGRLCRDKGIVELVEGFERFIASHSDSGGKLLLVGPYDERDSLPAHIVDRIENSERIIPVGPVRENIEYYYGLMDVFVFPSYREGFGMSVLEASAMEKPILVSRSHGCVGSIREGVTGLYIDLTAEAVCAGIARLIDPALRLRLGRSGRTFVSEHFDHTVMWPEVLKLYDAMKYND